MKILVVEDDAQIARFITRALREDGHVVRHATNGPDGLALAIGEPFDVAVVDVMLPGIDGLALIQQLRARHVQTPVLVLSSRATVDDRVRGLDAGGDDYLVKPFALSELLARLHALLRRGAQTTEPIRLVVGPLAIDLLRHSASCDGHELELQPREYALLEYLMRNSGRVVSKTMIMERVWEYEFDPETNVVEARICRLRDKLDRVTSQKLIHTVRGAGYVLEPRS